MMSLQLGETFSGFIVTETSSIGTPGGERSFSNLWGLQASFFFSPLPLPCNSIFGSCPNFLDELTLA